MKLLVLICLAFLPLASLANGLDSYPGWSLSKIEIEAEEGTYDQRVFFSLKPPDGRPAVTIDGSTAARIRNGVATPEAIYGSRADTAGNGANASSEGEEFVYSASNSQIVVAEGPSENAPVPESPAEPKEERTVSSSSPMAFGSLPPASAGMDSGGQSSESEKYTPAPKPAPVASSVANEQSKVASGETAANPAARVLPVRPGLPEPKRELAEAKTGEEQEEEKDNESDPKLSAIKTNSAPTGFGFKSKEQREKEEAEAKLPPAPCQPGEKVFDKADRIRVNIPKTCTNVFVTVWGAGGGSGYSGTRESGGENSNTITVRGGSGGGGAFVNGYGTFDAAKYDLVVVVGEAGVSGKAPTRREIRDERFPYRNNDNDNVRYEYVGGNDAEGGGLSGVYLVSKGGQGTSTSPDKALVVAGGGGGGKNYNGTGGAPGEGHQGKTGGEYSGGQGGLRGGAGGASFAKLGQGSIEGGNGSRAGFYYYPERNKAGDPGRDGKVILKYF